MLSEQVPRFVKELGAGHLLRVVKQDIYSLSNMSVVGAEYYTRSSLSSYEMPDDFFRLCFESKVLTTVDYHCFRACLKAAAESRISQRVHLNLFPSTLLAIPIERLVRDIAESQLQRILCVEISEQQLIGEPSYLLKAVETLKNEGVQVAIDDVGFGRSCLESLILLEPEIIKIDKRCVKGIAEDPALVRSMRRLLRVTGSLKTQVVAEGIERKEDLDAVVGLGVHYGQGYYLDEPSEN
jgi:EAL domain-containing protein (putative c-di-GMP-specific phosphodiesterase class I)